MKSQERSFQENRSSTYDHPFFRIEGVESRRSPDRPSRQMETAEARVPERLTGETETQRPAMEVNKMPEQRRLKVPDDIDDASVYSSASGTPFLPIAGLA